MSNLRNRYKLQAFGFANQDERRIIRAETDSIRRKTLRMKTFNKNRNILENTPKATQNKEPKIPTADEIRKARLLKWKMERDRRKKLEQPKKKRPFVVGKVTHKIYSPISTDERFISIAVSKTVCKPDPPKRITRATEKRLLLKAQLNQLNNVPTKTDSSVKNKQPNLSKKLEESFAPVGHKFKPPKNLKRVPLFGRESNSINDSFNGTLTPFVRGSRVSRKSSVANLPVQPKNSILKTSYTIEKKQDDDAQPINSILKTSYTIEEKQDDDEQPINSILKTSYTIEEKQDDDAQPINSILKTSYTIEEKQDDDAQTINNILKTSYAIEEKQDDGVQSISSIKTSYTIEEKQGDDDNDHTENEDSIEPVVLRLSSDDEEVFDSSKRHTRRTKKNNNNSSNNVNEKDKENNEKFSDSEKNKRFNGSKKNGKSNDFERNNELNGTDENEKFNISSKNGVLDSEKYSELTDSKGNEKFNNSKTRGSFNNSKTSKTLSDSNQSKKSNDFKKNENNQKLSNSYEDSEANIAVAINSCKNKDIHDIAKDASEGTQSLSNNDKSIFLSPYVVSRRGKTNARKKQQMKSGYNLNYTTNDCIPTKESVTKNVNISVKEEEHTAQYFELLLNKEIERQSQLCEKWAQIKEEPGVTEDAQYQINQAIGQTNLLMNKKFVKFRNLVSDCATGQGEMLVTCNDLQGFWDMMYIEVDDCNLRFQKLEQLRSREWVEEQIIAINKPRTRKKVATTKKVVRTKSNGIGAFLAKKKQNMVVGTQNDNDTENPGISINETLSSKYKNEEKSPETSIRPDGKFRMLRKLQLSHTKELNSPLTMMKISQMCKTPEVQLDDTISYINFHETPSRGILKQLNHSCTKSAHKINFKEKDEIRKSDAVLTETDDLNFDCVSHETRVERKLSFSDDDLEESSNISDDGRNSDTKKYVNTNMCTEKAVSNINVMAALQKSVLDRRSSTPLPSRKVTRQNASCRDNGIPSLNIIPATPLMEVVDNTDSNKSKQKLQIPASVNKEQETAEQPSDNIKVLRNRSIISGNTPIPKRRYSRNVSMKVQEFEYKENKTPMKATSKNLNKDNTLIDSEVDLHKAIRGMNLEEEYERRRSCRRSVKFSEKECSGCADKLIFSVTPHVRRSRAQSTEKKRSMTTKKSIDTTEKLPERVRRSRSRKL